MNIGLVLQSSNSFWELMQYSAPNKLEYCLKWKLKFYMDYCNKDDVNDKSSYERQTVILDAFKRCDWVWFMGADTIIMNQTIDVRQYIDDNYDFIIAHDVNGLNNDSCFYKNTPDTVEFINKTMHHLSHQPNDWFAQTDARRDMPNFKIKIVPQKLFNCYLYDSDPAYAGYPRNLPGDYKDGDFVLHFPAMCNMHRLELFKQYLPKVIK
jgi:hypothetical protein